MAFNSFEYIVFLVLVFTGYWLLSRFRSYRVFFLLIASCAFYMSYNATFILLLIPGTVLDYYAAHKLDTSKNERVRKFWITVSVVFNVGVLCVFKYADFSIEATGDICRWLGIDYEPKPVGLTPPHGLSFYTFHSLSYTIDVYRRRIPAHRNFNEFCTYIAFFPQLVMGPITRAKTFLPQFERKPALTTTAVGDGLFLILRGMIKKVAIADYLAVQFFNDVFDNPTAFTSTDVWIAVYGYTFQLYADFSAHTDIARGSAKLLGFELPENFNRPFTATGPVDFWRRWHMTLSTVVQDYLYVPLGGSQKGQTRTYINIFVSFLIMGIWHGAGWTFVCFAFWHATGVTVNQIYRRWRGVDGPPKGGWKRWVLMFCTFNFFAIHWPMFRSPDFPRMIDAYRTMFAFDGRGHNVPWEIIAIVIGMAVIHVTPVHWVDTARKAVTRLPAIAQAAVVLAVAAVLMYISAGQPPSAFVYEQF